MRLSTKGRYAVMAMADLARYEAGAARALALAEIAQRQEISLSYLEQLFARLRRKGLVKSARGPGGGYRLAKSAADTKIAEIVHAVDEPLRATRCVESKGCMHKGERCLTRDGTDDVRLEAVAAGRLDEGGERPAGHELHDQVGVVLVVAVVEDRRDVGVVQRGAVPGLVAEPGTVTLVGRRTDELDRDVATQIAGAMLGLDPGDELPEPDVHDAVGEVLNVVGGSVKGALMGSSALGLPGVTGTTEVPARDDSFVVSWGEAPVYVQIVPDAA